jgi:hypothetical protein
MQFAADIVKLWKVFTTSVDLDVDFLDSTGNVQIIFELLRHFLWSMSAGIAEIAFLTRV